MNKNIDLKDKVIAFIGGYGYLGKTIVEGLISYGAKVYVLGRNKDKFNEAFDQILNSHSLIHFVSCDGSNSDAISSAFEYIETAEKKIDVLINGTYAVKGNNPESISDEDWGYSIDNSLNNVYKSTREIIPYFKKNKGGKIINFSSMYGMVAPQFDVYNDFPQFLNPPHYGAAKAGIIQLTKYYASFLGKYNINVNAVSPGPFPSEKVQNEEGFIQELEKKTCLNRIGKPEDLIGIFVLLSSDASNYITGQNIAVDGGWTIK